MEHFMINQQVKVASLKEKLPRYLLLALALLFIIVGIVQGDFGDIRNRAINICLECIGIG